MKRANSRTVNAFAAGVVALTGTVAAAGTASASPAPNDFVVHTILSGMTLHHSFVPPGGTTRVTDPLTHPDDITRLGDDLFVGFQNGVGPQGEPTADGNTDSTVVEFTRDGIPINQWNVTGKTDGVTADPATGQVIATVNEDANSSLWVITPAAPLGQRLAHYHFNMPLPHDGGTDAITVEGTNIYISASAPGTTGAAAPQPSYPAVYSVSLDPAKHQAAVTPLFYDEATATVANLNSVKNGTNVSLALTDPDSNEMVPQGARFGGDMMLTSQGDLQQIFVQDAGTSAQHLSVLKLGQAVDDTAWPTSHGGVLYSTDSTNDTIDAITGPFPMNQPVVAVTPCGSNSAPSTCPAPPQWPANYLGLLNPWTGGISKLPTVGAAYTPQGGLLFVS